jgi:hypothetical protein
MPINQLYHTWIKRFRELRPRQRITQVRNFVWLMIGIFQSRSVHLSKVAGKIPGRAKLLSNTRRLGRLLDNPAIQVKEWYEPIAREWLCRQARGRQEVYLLIDGTKIGFGHQLLMVALAYRKRAIPIAWDWVPHVKGHSTVRQQRELLAYVKTLLPLHCDVLLSGDCEFGAVELLQQLDAWGWNYVLRQKGSTHICFADPSPWQDFASVITKAGQSLWLGLGYLAESAIYPTHLVAHWKKGEDEPWCLATNLPDLSMVLKAYSRRMWIEEMFGDLKRHGFDLESTMLHTPERLSRLTLAVGLLYVWLISMGASAIHDGLRHFVDRRDRRDLSIFQIGWRWIERCLVNALNFSIPLCVYL